MIDVDTLYPNIDDSVAQKILNDLSQQQKLIDTTNGSWNDYFQNLSEGEKWQIEFVQNTDLQKASLEDVKKGYDNARNSAIAHNMELKNLTLSAKAGKIALQGLAMAGNMFVMFAVTKGIQLAVKALDDYINRLDRAKEALESTESELSSVSEQIEENTAKIRELEALGAPSITDKEDLQQLRLQNEELRIRQKYLEQERQENAKKVSETAKEQYGVKYSSSATREDIDKYKELYENHKKSNSPASSYLTGGSNTTSSPYAASQQDSGIVKYSDNLADLIAQYEYFEEQKKKAVQAKDSEEIDKWNKKLEETAEKLREDRKEIQGFSDDLSASGESSPELDDALYKLKLIDDTLLTKGRNLVNFINSDSIEEDKEKLIELAESGKLTADVLSSKFSEVDKYLKDNGLTLEDLISILRTYKEEVTTTPTTPTTKLSFADTISQVQSLSKGLDQLDKIYSDVLDKESFDWSSILNNDDFKETFGGLGKDHDDFIKTISNSPSDINACQSAFDNLASAYINNSGVIKNLTEETKDSTIAMLEEMGVANAKEVVYDTLSTKTEALALQEQFLAENGVAIANATNDKVIGFLNEAGASETARAYLFQLVAAEQVFSNEDLNTAEKIAKLKELANAYGQTAIAARIANLEKANEDGHVSIDYDKELASLQNEVNNAINNVQIDFKPLTSQTSKAGKESGKSYKDALKDELSDLNNVLGYINDIIGDNIDLLNEQKDAAVDALEAEKEAAENALEAEKERIQAKIDAKQDEIDKIKEAREQRKAEIDLQKEQFNLERMQNQKTALIYKDGQMVYESDTEGIREARESVDEAKENIKILQIEKEISGLEDIIDSIDKKIEESNEYYDNLINQAETYWDSQIKAMEEYRDRWAQIGELEEQAKIQVALKELGIETEDILNMSGEAFDQFKQKYLGILTDIYSDNDAMVSALKEVANSADFSILDEKLLATKDNIDSLAGSSSSATEPIKSTASAMGELATNSEGVNEDINSINTALGTLSDGTKLDGIKSSFDELFDKIKEVSSALGMTLEETESSGTGLIGAIQALNEAQISTELLEQFTGLEDAINAVTSAINGDENNKTSNGSHSSVNGQSHGGGGSSRGGNTSDSGSSGSLTQALKTQVEEAKKLLPEEISLFSADEDSLLSAVTKVTTAIAGGGNSEGGEKKEKKGNESEADTSHLMGAVDEQFKLAEEKIPIETSYFTELASAIEQCVTHLKTMVETLENMPSATISISGSASVNGSAHYEGTANVRGNWGVRESGKSLLGELGQELVVRGSKFFTVGNNGAEFVDLQRGDIVFNHIQTKSLLKNGYVTGRGNAYANGTVGNDTIIKTSTNIPSYLRPLQEGDKDYDLRKKFEAYFEAHNREIIAPVHDIQKNMETMVNNIQNVNTDTINKPTFTINGGINVSCPGVNSQEIMNQVSTALYREIGGIALEAMQEASITR